jgi:DNA-binding response OmpR family regulator
MKAKILVVDDEAGLRDSLSEILRGEDFYVDSAASGEAAIELLSRYSYDLMLLDLMMPGLSGVDVMRVSRDLAPDTKVILLTAHGSLESAVDALRLGAHDYILKPATAQAILASISRGLARRAEKEQRKILLEQLESSLQRLRDAEGIQALASTEQAMLPVGNGVMYDTVRRELWWGEKRIGLTPTEARLLQVLVQNKGRVLPYKELVLFVQGYEPVEWEAPEVLRPLISRLRQKLAEFPGGKYWIGNVRGTGYTFDPGRSQRRR